MAFSIYLTIMEYHFQKYTFSRKASKFLQTKFAIEIPKMSIQNNPSLLGANVLIVSVRKGSATVDEIASQFLRSPNLVASIIAHAKWHPRIIF